MPRPRQNLATKAEPSARTLKVENFTCQKCHKSQQHLEMDFRQKVGTCKGCAPNYPEERITGAWLMKNGYPRLASILTE